MTTPDHLDGIARSRLTSWAASTVLAVGLGMAAMGLTAAIAGADPAPPNTPSPNPTAGQHPHSESGLCNQTVVPRGAPAPPPGYCG